MFEVYCHTSPSGKRYVGYSQAGMAARWSEHVQEARSGSDRLVCRAIRKHGAGSFKHELLAQCDTREGACTAERYWIRARNTFAPAGYNATEGGEGVTPAPHVREKLFGNTRGAGNKGVRRTPEQCEAMHLRGLGKKLSPETIAKRSAAQRGRKRNYSAESKRSISAAVSAANARRVWSPEARAAQADKSRHRTHTPGEREKMSRAWTPEMRRAAAERLRARHAARKQERVQL